MNFRLLLDYLTPHRSVLATIVALLLAGAATALAQPWLAGEVTAQLIASPGTGAGLYGLLGIWLALIVTRAVLGFATQYLIGTTGENVTAELRSRLFQHLQAMPLAYHQRHASGQSLALLSNDAEQISRFVTNTMVQLLPLGFTFLGALAMMLFIDPAMAGLIALFLPVLVLCMKLVGRRLRPLAQGWVEAYAALMAFVSENLALQPAVKSFDRGAREQARFGAHNDEVLSLSRRRILAQSMLSPAVGLLASSGVLLLLWLGSLRIASGNLQPAELVSLLLYALLLVQPLRGLASVYGTVQVTRGAAERIIDFLGQQPEPGDHGKGNLTITRGDIHFRSVGFRYDNGGPVLENFDLSINGGECVAITGPNGAGKSTLALLLLRLADPASGAIDIDGTDLRTVRLGSLRRQIGLVAQHTLLANASIADNIAYGRPGASRRDIVRAARLAQAHEFVTGLPEGYDTVIGEQGLRLSGGQRQRIALARALLPDPPILVLDEATSMFDPRGEADFIEGFRRGKHNRTVLLITHRPASLALADRVVELGAPVHDRRMALVRPRKGGAE
jgi:ABC-type multidrug transport system fused ATPase/permease subunit